MSLESPQSHRSTHTNYLNKLLKNSSHRQHVSRGEDGPFYRSRLGCQAGAWPCIEFASCRWIEARRERDGVPLRES